MKRILIHATQTAEIQVAVIDNQQLLRLDIESPAQEVKKGDIYKGRVSRIEPSMDAVFVDYGVKQHGFLALNDIAREYFPKQYLQRGQPSIEEVFTEGQELIVQIKKSETVNEEAKLTTLVFLPGTHLVLSPNNPYATGISIHLTADEREELKETSGSLQLPLGMGLIVRAVGLGKSTEELAKDLDKLIALWNTIKKTAASTPAPLLIHKESDLIDLTVRDYLSRDIDEVIIDSRFLYMRVRECVKLNRPELANRVKKYEEKTPIFNHFNIDRQFESMRKKKEAASQDRSKESPPPAEGTATITKNSVRQNKNTNIERHHVHKTEHERKTDHVSQPFRLGDLGSKFLYWLFGR